MASHQMIRHIKDKLSSKTTETKDPPRRSRLPPLQRTNSNLADLGNGTEAAALPPIRGTNPAPLPSITDNKEAESTFTNHSHQNRNSSANNPPTYATVNHEQYPNSQPAGYPEPDSYPVGHAPPPPPPPPIPYLPPPVPQPIPQASSFQTSESRGYRPPESATVTISESEQERRLHIEQNGIRTYPLFAILATFFCNPICGVLAGLLTLVAADNYYKKRFITARNTAVVANILILVSLIFGVLMYIGFIIWGAIINNE